MSDVWNEMVVSFYYFFSSIRKWMIVLFFFPPWKEWNGEMDRQVGTGKATISYGLLLSLLHMSVYTLGKVMAQHQSLHCFYDLLFLTWITLPLNLVSGSRKSPELCARIFSASKRTCVHWGPLNKKWQSPSPALLHVDYLCKSTFSSKLWIQAL